MFVIFLIQSLGKFWSAFYRPEESDKISTYWLKIDVDDKISN